MQLGARWRRGEAPHRSVPQSLIPLIELQEANHPTAGSWTLTWLEGRPRAMLDHLLVVTLDTDGTPRVEPQYTEGGNENEDIDEDDWLT